MLYYLLHLDESGAAGVSCGRAELRLLLAALSALAVVVVLGPWFIRFVRSKQFLEPQEKGDSQKLDTLHAHKATTPTLGGVLLFAGVLVSTLLWARLGDRGVLLLMGVAAALSILGFLDDARKLRSRRKGMSARAKFLCQVGLSALLGVYLYVEPLAVRSPAMESNAGTCLFVPFIKDLVVPLGAGFVLLEILVVAGTSNAVNLTDGLDGLAIGLGILAAATLAVWAFLCGRADSSAALGLPRIEGGVEVAVFLAAILGAGLGFLWFNGHPAQIFMGDTGSLPLGGCLGLAAVLSRQEVTLLVAGGVFAVEALSVILQVGSFKLRRKRIFLIAPLHHHYQFKGWSEPKVTVRFWIVGAILALASLLTLRIG